MRINLKIRYFPDGRWEGGGLLPRQLKDFSDLSEWIKSFLIEVKDIKKLYLTSIQDDERLLGQEKANIIIEIDEIIGGLLLLRQYLSPGRAFVFSSDDGKGQLHSVRLLDSTWTGSGKLSQSNELDGLSFSNLHNDMIMTKVRDLFRSYGEAVKDRNISAEELNAMFEKIDSLFCDFLRIERIMLYTNKAN